MRAIYKNKRDLFHSEPHGRDSRTRGFTLIELLVVVTIIAILASLIMVGTNTAMTSANKTRTISQMRAVGVGVVA